MPDNSDKNLGNGAWEDRGEEQYPRAFSADELIKGISVILAIILVAATFCKSASAPVSHIKEEAQQMRESVAEAVSNPESSGLTEGEAEDLEAILDLLNGLRAD